MIEPLADYLGDQMKHDMCAKYHIRFRFKEGIWTRDPLGNHLVLKVRRYEILKPQSTIIENSLRPQYAM